MKKTFLENDLKKYPTFNIQKRMLSYMEYNFIHKMGICLYKIKLLTGYLNFPFLIKKALIRLVYGGFYL